MDSLTFFSLAALYTDQPFPFTNPLVQGSGEVVFSHLPADTIQTASEGVLGQVLARQLVFFCLLQEEKVGRSHI